MKPSVDISQKESVINVPRDYGNNSRRTSRWIIGMVVGTLSVSVIAGIILAVVYVGMSAQREAYKGGWMTLINKDDPTISITEKIVVSKSEVDVTQPGTIRFIYNNDMGTIVILPDEPVQEGHIGTCFVADIGIEVDTEALGNSITSNIREELSFEENMHVFQSTGARVDAATLSPRAQEMCIGREILQVEEVDDEGRVRRNEPKETTTKVSILWGVFKWEKTVKN